VLNTAAGATNAVPTDSASDNLTNCPRVLLQFQTKGLGLGSQQLSLSPHSRILLRTLTVKLRGRTEAPDQSRGCTLSSRTRGDTTDFHGPLQRLLDRMRPADGTECLRPTIFGLNVRVKLQQFCFCRLNLGK
jgi:hypothetical protein